MDRNKKAGFTIIETMLFLSVSALLTVGILAGTGIAMTQQRYKDSVNTFKSDLQAQYNQVANVVNDRGSDYQCNSSAAITSTSPGAGVSRGQTDCMVMGRLVTSYPLGSGSSTSADGIAIYSYPVIGTKMPSAPASPDKDIDVLRTYNLRPMSSRSTVNSVEWGARIETPTGSNRMSILILRSPINGAIKTFSHTGAKVSASGTIQNGMVRAENVQDFTICVKPAAGTIITGPTLGVEVAAGASNQSGVKVLGEGNPC